MQRPEDEVAYRLPPERRADLREPFAPVMTEEQFTTAVQEGNLGRPLVAVGDVVADTMLRHHLDPLVIVYDLSTKRDMVGAEIRARLSAHKARHIRVRSPAATLTHALVEAVREAVTGSEKTKIQVDGEEDLATLPALAFTPPGGTVIYGMPNRGLVPVPVGADSKARAEHWLSLMKVGGDD